MAQHRVEPSRHTLHGVFSNQLPPVLTISPGESIAFCDTPDVSWGLEPPVDTVQPRKKFEPRNLDRDQGPALLGPIAVEGAQPGMTLEVHLEKIQTYPWGFTYAGGPGYFNKEWYQQLGVSELPLTLMRWTLDPDKKQATNQYGHTVRTRPFPGTIGIAPHEPGLHPGWFPRATGGNMDCKELTEGSRLYLPIEVPGALLSLGDGHAAQGNGEVAGMAIECRMKLVQLRCELKTDFPIYTPHIWNSHAWSTLGFHQDLDQATSIAMNAMLDLIQRNYKLARHEALALASAVVDLQRTQNVNGVRGVHASLPHKAIQTDHI